MSPQLMRSIDRVEAAISRAADRVDQELRDWGKGCAGQVIAFRSRLERRLDQLLEQLPEEERQARLRFRAIVDAAYMTKQLGAGNRVEIYGRDHRLLAVQPLTDWPRLERALIDAGRIREGRWRDYTGGFSREPGLALWWKREQD